MKITFLGTGTSQGVPVIACGCEVCSSPDVLDRRLRSSLLVEEGGQVFVIDTGPDFREQMLREQVKRLDFVLLTHDHRDHLAGLDDIRSFNWLQDCAMDVFAEHNVLDSVRHVFYYVFSEQKYPGIPEMNLVEIDDSPFTAKGVHIIPIRGYHHHLPVLGFRVGSMAYITDVNHIPDEEYYKLDGLEILILDALRKKKHMSHFCLDEAIQVAEKIGANKTYFTHISHLMGFHREINAMLPSGIELAYDGLKIEL